jgi:hypothetical protein
MKIKSDNCTESEHASCDGIFKETLADGSDVTKMCACQCHNSSYQLVKRMTAAINQKGT